MVPCIHVVMHKLLPVAVCIALLPSLLLGQEVDVNNSLQSVRHAPGDRIPFQVRLSNFGGGSRVDVLVRYEVLSESGDVIIAEDETLAVETTASYIHTLVLPADIASGAYIARVAITYPGQSQPASSSFRFTVAPALFGVFLRDAAMYVLALAAASGGAYLLLRRHPARKGHEYSHIPPSARIYYEIISDILHEMRLHSGDKALVLARNVPGLTIGDDGRIQAVNGDPADVVARLIEAYETDSNSRISLSFGKRARKRLIRPS